MGQAEVLNFLQKYPMQWFTSRQISEKLKSKSIVNSVSKVLEWYPEVEKRINKFNVREIRWNPKPRKSFKQIRKEANRWKDKTTWSI